MSAAALARFAIAGASLAVLALSILPASAQNRSSRGYDRYPADGYVVAESWLGGSRVVGRVRMTSRGRQVQLPGGSWEYCGRSCSETLRKESIDFWDAQTETGAQTQGFLLFSWPRY